MDIHGCDAARRILSICRRQLHGLDACGIGGPADAGDGAKRPEAWTTYVAVTDVGAAAARIEAAGGHVLVGPSDVGEWGRSAVCRSVGCAFRQARQRLGAQVVNTPGAWNFSDLHAADPERPRRSTPRYSGGPSTISGSR